MKISKNIMTSAIEIIRDTDKELDVKFKSEIPAWKLRPDSKEFREMVISVAITKVAEERKVTSATQLKALAEVLYGEYKWMLSETELPNDEWVVLLYDDTYTCRNYWRVVL